MIIEVAKTFLAALIITFCSWLAHRRPELAGYITALPLISVLALAFNAVQFDDASKTVLYARSIITAVPISLLFFLPFFLTEGRSAASFWMAWGSGLFLLGGGYFLHQWIMKFLG